MKIKKPTIENTVMRIIYEVENRREISRLEQVIERDIKYYIDFGDLLELDKREKKRLERDSRIERFISRSK